MNDAKPIIFHRNNRSDEKKLQHLLELDTSISLGDSFNTSIEDLFKLDFPYIQAESLVFKKTYAEYRRRYYSGDRTKYGVWIYYPWRKIVVHTPDEHSYNRLRTARNKELISQNEQDAFYNAKISVAGLSVGLSIINSIVLSGGAQTIHMADPDVLALTNMNRLQASVCDLGEKKIMIAARKIYEINPFAQLRKFEHGLRENNFFQFFGGNDYVNLYIEEMDDIQMKIISRLYAREHRIPVVMATDNGDNAIIDVERFDLEPNRPLFHGLVKENELIQKRNHLTMVERVKLASKIVGHNITPRTKISLQMVGTKLASWPQLGNAATLSGVGVSYVARRILTAQSMPSGRYSIDLDRALDTTYNDQTQIEIRDSVEKNYSQGLELLFGVKYE